MTIASREMRENPEVAEPKGWAGLGSPWSPGDCNWLGLAGRGRQQQAWWAVLATPPLLSASHPLTPTFQREGYVNAEVASDTLVALSRNHFSLVMYELQHHLKPLNLTEEFVIVTLAKLANGNGRRGPQGWASTVLPHWCLPA